MKEGGSGPGGSRISRRKLRKAKEKGGVGVHEKGSKQQAVQDEGARARRFMQGSSQKGLWLTDASGMVASAALLQALEAQRR